MIHLKVEDAAVIPLSVDSSPAVPMTVTEAFIEGGGGGNLQPNKNATAATSQVVVEPDEGYDGMEKVTIAAIPMGESNLDIFYSGNKVTAQSMITKGGYFEQYTGTIVEDYLPSGSASVPATTITPTTNITVDSSGLVSAGVTGSQSITPSVQSGYVSSGTAGTVTVSGSGSYQLPTDAGSVVTPSTSQQTVDVDGKFMTGDVVVNPIPSEYIIPAGTKQITANGTGIDVAQYAAVDVSVSGGELTWDEVLEKDFSGVVNAPNATEIGMYTFYQISDITAINAPEVVTVRDFSIYQCSGITTLNFPKCTTVNQYAFARCYYLQTVVLPKATSIAQYMLENTTRLQAVDFGVLATIPSNSLRSMKSPVLILRKSDAICTLASTNAFTSTPFASGGAGGTIYIPKSLYDHLGDGTSLDYKAATNWTTINGYGTITWAKIEGSQYENYYADGTPIT